MVQETETETAASTGTTERRKTGTSHESALTLRKRKLDRIAQRSARERTKNRINFLENKVKVLEASGDYEQFASVLETQESLLTNNTELKALLMKIRMTADAVLSPDPDKGAPRGTARSTCTSD